MRWNRRDTTALIGLVLAPFVFYWRLFVPGSGRHYFEAGDFVDQFYAFAHYEAASLAAGRIPLWNSFAFSGSPFWADVQAAVAYPPSLVTVLASIAAVGRLPFLALELEAVAHLALAGALTYLFARRVVGCRSGAVVTALAFALGGYLTGYPVLQLAVLESNAWLPLALLGVILLTDGRAWLGTATVAAATGMGVLAGHPQSALYLVVATIAYGAWRLWPITFGFASDSEVAAGTEDAAGVGGPRVRRRLTSASARPWLLLPAGLALGLGLSAAGWLPALEYTRLSNRAAADYATVSHGFPPRELVGALVAGLTKWSPLYIGVLPLLLAAVGVLRSFGEPGRLGAGDAQLDTERGSGRATERGSESDAKRKTAHQAEQPAQAPHAAILGPRREGRFWTAAAAIALVLSLGGRAFLFDVFYLLAPGFDMFRGQERAAFLFSFSVALLAGLGFAAWRRCDVGGMRCAADRVVLGGGVAIALLGVVASVASSVASPDLRALGIRLVLLGGGAALLALARSTGRLRPGTLTAGALALIAIDLYLVGATTNLQQGAPGELHSTPVIEAMSRSESFVRVQNEDRLPRNFGVLHELESTYGASPMRPQAYDTLRDGLAGSHESRWWDVAAVSHVLTSEQDIGGPDVTDGSVTGDEGTVHELENFRPYAWIVACAETVADDATALDRLRDPAVSPYLVAILHADESRGLSSVESDAPMDEQTAAACMGPDGPNYANDPPHDSDVTIRTRAPGVVEARVLSPAPGWLVVSEGYYPGWRAEVDGAAVGVLRASVAFMAVPVPEGDHEVRLTFNAPMVALGLAVSLLSAVAVGALVLIGWRRRSAEPGGESVGGP